MRKKTEGHKKMGEENDAKKREAKTRNEISITQKSLIHPSFLSLLSPPLSLSLSFNLPQSMQNMHLWIQLLEAVGFKSNGMVQKIGVEEENTKRRN